MSATIRPLTVDDVPELTTLLNANREFLAPWEPTRRDTYFHEETQLQIAERSIEARTQGSTLPLVILDEDCSIAGRLDLNGITRGAFQSAALGYWVNHSVNRRGLATRAVAEAIGLGFTELGLHRLQAETLFSNIASQRVLAKNGFRPFGVAPDYLRINGRWQDHILYQLIADDAPR